MHKTYDAIIILANLMDNRGHLNDESRARMDAGIAIFRAGAAPKIITTGWAYREDSDLPVAEAQRHYALAQGVPVEVLICDTDARDTVGDAVFSKRNILLPKDWKHLLVVTSDYHVARTREIFTFVYGPGYAIEVIGADTGIAGREAGETESLAAFRATFAGVTAGDDAAIWQRLRARHPFYNGVVYPAI